MLAVLAVLCGAVTAAAAGPTALTLAVVLPERNLTYPWAWPRVGPAVRLAVAAVNARRDLLPGFHLRWVFGSSEDRHGVCSEMAAPLAAVDLRLAHHPAAFLGPGCVYTAAPVARFTSHWRLPLVTAGAEAHGFDDKQEQFGLTTRAGPSHRKLGELGVQLHRRFNWTRRALLVYWDEKVDDRPYFFAAEGLYVQLPTLRNLTVMDIVFRDSGNFSFIIQEIKQKGRGECRGDTHRRPGGDGRAEGMGWRGVPVPGTALHGRARVLTAAHGRVRPCPGEHMRVQFYTSVRLCMALPHCTQLYPRDRGRAWLRTAPHGCARVCGAGHGSTWVCTGVWGRTRLHTGVHKHLG